MGVQAALEVEMLFYQLNLEGKALAQLQIPICYRKWESRIYHLNRLGNFDTYIKLNSVS